MSLRLWILILVAGLSFQAKAVDAVCSYTIFYSTGTSSMNQAASVETIWQVNPLSLHYRKNENGDLVSQVQADLVFRNQSGIVHEEHYILKTTPAAPGLAAGIKVLDMQRTSLPVGKIAMELRLSEPEVKNAKDFTFTDSLQISVPDNVPFFSNLQLIDTFIDSKKENVFLKNGHQQVPMPTNFFDENRKSLNYYTELYQSLKADTSAFPLQQRIFISRKMQEGVLAGLEKKDTITTGNMLLKYSGHFSLAHLGSGNYYLNAELTNRNGQVLATNSTFFQLINKNPIPMQPVAADTSKSAAGKPEQQSITYLNLDKTFVAKYTLPQLRAILKMLLPVSDPAQTKAISNFLERPDDIYMRYFIYNFFAAKDKNHPEKAWEEFADRVREVNRQFGKGSRNGYETERGFVYLKYGKPDDIVSVISEPGALPYEVWQYYSLGKQSQEGIFLFYQPGSQVSDYKLLHSTVTGEIKNPNWKSVLYTSGVAGNNSRADQLIRNR